MEIDAKQKVLFAFYVEYQKDIPNMAEVTASVLQMEENVFKIALVKLKNEELIQDLSMRYVDQKLGLEPYYVIYDRAKLTPRGIEYVEEKLKIERSESGMGKVKNIRQKLAEFGWNVGVQFTADVLAAMVKKQAGISG